MSKYSIGIDFGTSSGRVLIVDVDTGEELAQHVTDYPHGVITERLPGASQRLAPDWALQHPSDYVEVLKRSVPAALRLAGIDPADVIGIGVDMTACTMLPVDASGNPLCMQAEHAANPHSWVKLWKHHAAQEEADRLNTLALAQGQAWLARYGGRISSEWMLPKIWQTLNEAPDIYEAADCFMEAADWVVRKLTGELVRSSSLSGFKSLWHKKDGYPSSEFFRQLDPRLESLTATKLSGEIRPLGAGAGLLTAEMADSLGLPAGIAVAVALIDAHAAVPGCGVVDPGNLVMVMGTSTCHLLLGHSEQPVEGICGVVEDGIIPGVFGYEAGQAAVGDLFGWFVDRQVPPYVHEEAARQGLGVHEWLEKHAATYRPGETGLLALDWWNGNRSVLIDSTLTGMIVGLTLSTKPEEVYRALLEATAFSTKTIIDAYEAGGQEVHTLYACGGLPHKNKLLMQIYADVTGRRIHIAVSTQTPALGSAIMGAVAAGASAGGYATCDEAVQRMVQPPVTIYDPNPDNVGIYKELYTEYLRLHDYFGRGLNPVMKALKARRT
ncbi:MAG: ribulokinase [Paenibacillus sp.]|nr:ribulokinase [Paenibacillus sp.]